jgi:hypothetical protein
MRAGFSYLFRFKIIQKRSAIPINAKIEKSINLSNTIVKMPPKHGKCTVASRLKLASQIELLLKTALISKLLASIEE